MNKIHVAETVRNVMVGYGFFDLALGQIFANKKEPSLTTGLLLRTKRTRN